MKLSLVPSVQFFLHLSNLGGKIGLIEHTSHVLQIQFTLARKALQSKMTV